MSDEYKIVYSSLPLVVKNVLFISEGWLIGGALSKETIKDYDIIVPNPKLLHKTILALDSPFTLNSFGGFKFTTRDSILLDIWCESLDNIIDKTVYAFSLHKSVLIKNI